MGQISDEPDRYQPKLLVLLCAHSCLSVERRSSSKADIPFAGISSSNRWKAKTGPRHPPHYEPRA
jgi:hypothetical protein